MGRSSTNDPPVAPAHDNSGQFATGFFVGILGGMVGMYLFGTKQGHRTLELIRVELAKTMTNSDTAQKAEAELLEAANMTATIVKSGVKRLSTRFPTFKQHT
jgi:hypothetical protein